MAAEIFYECWPEERRQYRVHFRIFAFQCHTCRGYNGNIDRQSQITNAFCGEQKESFLTEKSCGFRFFHFLPLFCCFSPGRIPWRIPFRPFPCDSDEEFGHGFYCPLLFQGIECLGPVLTFFSKWANVQQNDCPAFDQSVLYCPQIFLLTCLFLLQNVILKIMVETRSAFNKRVRLRCTRTFKSIVLLRGSRLAMAVSSFFKFINDQHECKHMSGGNSHNSFWTRKTGSCFEWTCAPFYLTQIIWINESTYELGATSYPVRKKIFSWTWNQVGILWSHIADYRALAGLILITVNAPLQSHKIIALGNVMKNLSGKKAKLIAGGLFVVMAGARYAPPN